METAWVRGSRMSASVSQAARSFSLLCRAGGGYFPAAQEGNTTVMSLCDLTTNVLPMDGLVSFFFVGEESTQATCQATPGAGAHIPGV